MDEAMLKREKCCMNAIIIIGGGLNGLVAAWRLQQLGADVLVAGGRSTAQFGRQNPDTFG